MKEGHKMVPKFNIYEDHRQQRKELDAWYQNLSRQLCKCVEDSRRLAAKATRYTNISVWLGGVAAVLALLWVALTVICAAVR